MITKVQAKEIIEEVKNAMQSWKTEAKRLGLPQRDIEIFAPRFNRWL